MCRYALRGLRCGCSRLHGWQVGIGRDVEPTWHGLAHIEQGAVLGIAFSWDCERPKPGDLGRSTCVDQTQASLGLARYEGDGQRCDRVVSDGDVA